MTDLIYDETIDNKLFSVQVERTGERTGTLIVRKVYEDADDEVLLREETDLYFGAPFGPDVSDVGRWQEQALAAADAWYAQNGLTPPAPSVPDEPGDEVKPA